MSKSKPTKADLLRTPIEHLDIKQHDTAGLVGAMQKMAFSARDLATAAGYFEKMLTDRECSVFLGLAGSLVSAGLKQVVIDMIDCHMVDAIVSTGAIIVDQDFFEALGFRHYLGTQFVDDRELQRLHIDRIYDTFIDEDDLRVCDMTTAEIASALEPRPYSSREFIAEMGRWLVENGKAAPSIVRRAYEEGVPIFCPAFSDCSAGFGLVHHQWHSPEEHVSIDSAKDFLELTKIKLEAKETGIFLVGGGVPKNFIQDTVVCGDVLGQSVPMHKYAIQITVADARDGALSGSTLKEACSWGKVDMTYEQMVFAEATLAMPLIVGYAYHRGAWKGRQSRRYADFLESATTRPLHAS
jgi:deoxyhypusine synthase